MQIIKVGISGSSGSNRLNSFCKALGKALVQNQFGIVSGGRKYVGFAVSQGAFEYLTQQNASDALKERMIITYSNESWREEFPLPYFGTVRLITQQQVEDYRNRFLSEVTLLINIEGREGTWKEFELADKMGIICVPLAFTGGSALKIWKAIEKKFPRYYSNKVSQASFNQLLNNLSLDVTIPNIINILTIMREKIMDEARKGIFICYSHSDKKFVQRFSKDLKRNNIRIWVDDEELKLGDSLIDTISEGIEKMDYLAAVLSPEAVKSGWVKKELEIAMTKEIQGKKIKVLPIIVKKCKLPPYLVGKLYADFTEKDSYRDSLQKIIKRFNQK